MHVANGMYGLILVEPPEGLPPVDHEYYVMQGDFYTIGKYREKGHQPFDMEKAIDENADLRAVQRRGRRAHRRQGAEGEGRRDACACSSATAARTSCRSFHVIGEIFDKVQYEGGTHFQENVQTTLIPAGGAAIVEFHVEVPGSYVLVDHSIFRAFNKGALAILEGRRAPEHKTIYSGKEVDEVYLGDQRRPNLGAGDRPRRRPRAAGTLTRTQQIEAGKALFKGTCSVCHQDNGEGLPERVPAAGEVRLPRGGSASARSASCSTASPGKVTVNGSDVQLGHAADEPAQRRRGREHPHLRAQQLGQHGRRRDQAKQVAATCAPAPSAPRARRTDADARRASPACLPALACAQRSRSAAQPDRDAPHRRAARSTPCCRRRRDVKVATVVAPFRMRRDAGDAMPSSRASCSAASANGAATASPRVFADDALPAHWASAADPGERRSRAQPVTQVSWFAAQARTAKRAARGCPRWYEWEYAAAADATRADARDDPAWRAAASSTGMRDPARESLPRGRRRRRQLLRRSRPARRGLGVGRRSRRACWSAATAASRAIRTCKRSAAPARSSLEQKENYAMLMRIAMLSSMKAAYTSATMGFRCATGPEAAP